MRRFFLLRVVPAFALLLASSGIAFAQSTRNTDLPFPGASNFVKQIDNPYFPLKPGTTFIYEGTKDGEAQRVVFKVTHRTRVILGVRTTVITDQAFVAGKLEESTIDYFAQDRAGNVWYFGEDTQELDAQGRVITTKGTWLAGRDGARPGIVMEAHPKVGDTYHQERAGNVAQDMATVLSVDEDVRVPEGKFEDVLKTKDFTPLEPAKVEHKYFAPGVGQILTVRVSGGGEERMPLVDVKD
jgi:hypothetical protein